MKRLMLPIVLSALLFSPLQCTRPTYHEPLKTAAIISAGAVVTGAIGYVLYGWYEDICLNRALTRLVCNIQVLREIIAEKNMYSIQDEQAVIQHYHNRYDTYHSICLQIERTYRQIATMHEEIKHDIRAWENYAKAVDFLQRARLFSTIITKELHAFEPLVVAYNNNDILLQLSRMLQEEFMSSYATIITQAGNLALDEATVRALAAQSAWPLRTVWQELQQRKTAYQSLINQMKGTSINTGATLQQSFLMISRYEKAQQIIAGFRGYTDDIRAEKEFTLREEQLYNERVQAQAALASAQAHQAQAKLQKDQLAQHKKSELSRLRTELSELKQRIANGDNSYYTYQQKSQLQNRISEIKRDINGSYTFGELLFDLFTDRD
ncbi:MAG: hypothetical protein WCE21_02070 [Candidatus Babeliales bacterium]